MTIPYLLNCAGITLKVCTVHQGVLTMSRGPSLLVWPAWQLSWVYCSQRKLASLLAQAARLGDNRVDSRGSVWLQELPKRGLHLSPFFCPRPSPSSFNAGCALLRPSRVHLDDEDLSSHVSSQSRLTSSFRPFMDTFSIRTSCLICRISPRVIHFIPFWVWSLRRER
jgi:hypothetical protein